jgi:translation initiation factor 3 subunit H
MSDQPTQWVVQLDGLVLLKIIKHCKEAVSSQSEIATGTLLGLDVDDVLEVTNCFPLPSDAEGATKEEYQLQMMKHLRTVNVDSNTVGWYQSAMTGFFYNSATIETQLQHQKDIPTSVVIVYDPFHAAHQKLDVHAYRITDKFMKLYGKGVLSQGSLGGVELLDVMDANLIFEEIPIKVHNSHLVHAFLYEMLQGEAMNCDEDRLSHSNAQLLDKNITHLVSALDLYAIEQRKYQAFARERQKQLQVLLQQSKKREDENLARKAQGQEPLPEEDLAKALKLSEPSRLESFLFSNQINAYCADIQGTTSQLFHKLYAMEGLVKAQQFQP